MRVPLSWVKLQIYSGVCYVLLMLALLYDAPMSDLTAWCVSKYSGGWVRMRERDSGSRGKMMSLMYLSGTQIARHIYSNDRRAFGFWSAECECASTLCDAGRGSACVFAVVVPDGSWMHGQKKTDIIMTLVCLSRSHYGLSQRQSEIQIVNQTLVTWHELHTRRHTTPHPRQHTHTHAQVASLWHLCEEVLQQRRARRPTWCRTIKHSATLRSETATSKVLSAVGREDAVGHNTKTRNRRFVAWMPAPPDSAMVTTTMATILTINVLVWDGKTKAVLEYRFRIWYGGGKSVKRLLIHVSFTNYD